MSDHPANAASALAHIKRRATSIKKSQGIKHARALDLAAVQSGYQNFRHAQNVLSRDSVAVPLSIPMFKVNLIGHWHQRGGDRSRGRESLVVELPKPWYEAIPRDRLGRSRYVSYFDAGSDPDTLVNTRSLDSADEARRIICGAARTFVFAAATGLRESSGHSRAYPRDRDRQWSNQTPERYHRRIPGQDHISVWFDPSTRRYLIVDEPYTSNVDSHKETREKWCEFHDYSMARPLWPGMYAPDIGSRMHLFSSSEKGIPLGPIVDALNALPAPVTAKDWKGESELLPRFSL